MTTKNIEVKDTKYLRYGIYPRFIYDDEKRELISQRLKEIRLSFQCTQLQWSEKLNVSKRTIKYWEQGKKGAIPSTEHLEKLSNLSGKSIDWLLGGE
ncbi:helix-turn-helix domain-containing protein [Catellicoccus marimammalium]|uniref:HTH cro/C1-type domain-containing protein n=1 Tax=Catellicoccus marimammalium M35/04/3 TaxID=1234409 RepID=K8Z8J5_9ENTE|nr:helix-turn-helix transcriptional regulator [Catellicoccus marimammalium]EKU27200.1 hypothetical protein C683_0857 [Catellicoccus marimammalium M35/04/3]